LITWGLSISKDCTSHIIVLLCYISPEQMKIRNYTGSLLQVNSSHAHKPVIERFLSESFVRRAQHL